MFTVTDILTEYKRLDAIYKKDIAITVKVSTTGRCVKRMGVYKFKRKGASIYNEQIVISDFMLEATPEEFYDTIRHEYAHAVATRQAGQNVGHGEIWKCWAEKVGAKPEQYATEICEAQQARIEARHETQKEYQVICDCCNHTWKYHRKGKIVKRVESGKYSIECPYCHGTQLSMIEVK